MKIGRYKIHRKHQDDLDVAPIVCVHRALPSPRVGSERVFCLWLGGITLGRRFIRTWGERSGVA